MGHKGPNKILGKDEQNHIPVVKDKGQPSSQPKIMELPAKTNCNLNNTDCLRTGHTNDRVVTSRKYIGNHCFRKVLTEKRTDSGRTYKISV